MQGLYANHKRWQFNPGKWERSSFQLRHRVKNVLLVKSLLGTCKPVNSTKENSLTQKASYLRFALGSFRCHQVITARLCRMRMENEYFRATSIFPRACVQPILVRGGEVVYYGTFDVIVPPGTKNYNFNLIGKTRGIYENLARSDRDLIRSFVERPIQRR